jgi:hypothetical protein
MEHEEMGDDGEMKMKKTTYESEEGKHGESKEKENMDGRGGRG